MKKYSLSNKDPSNLSGIQIKVNPEVYQIVVVCGQ